jgi:probable O-glycosylation ligase (exosortase A-associated)
MKGWLLTQLVVWAGTFAAVRYPLIGLNVYMGLAVLRPQFIFGFAGDLTGLSLIVGLAVIIGWALQGFGSWRTRGAKPIVLSFLAFVLWFVLSSLTALEPDRSYSALFEFAKLAMPFLIGLTLMAGEKDWRPTLWTLVLCQGYVGLEQNINYLIKGFNTAGEGFGGMDNNCFGVSLVTTLGPAVALMLCTKKWYARAAAGLSAAFILHTIMLTYSRGAMLGLLTVGATAFVILPTKPRYIGALVLTALVAAYFTGPQLLARYKSTFASERDRDSSAESRFDLWRDCLQVVGDYPITGVGPANWRVVAARYGWPPGKSAHSVWMETAAEMGLPGTLFLFFFFAFGVVKLWPIARSPITDENRNEVILATGVVLAIVGFMVSGQFVSVPGLEVPYYFVMLGAAMLTDRAVAARQGDVVAPAFQMSFSRPATVVSSGIAATFVPPARRGTAGGSADRT